MTIKKSIKININSNKKHKQ